MERAKITLSPLGAAVGEVCGCGHSEQSSLELLLDGVFPSTCPMARSRRGRSTAACSLVALKGLTPTEET